MMMFICGVEASGGFGMDHGYEGRGHVVQGAWRVVRGSVVGVAVPVVMMVGVAGGWW